MNTKLDFMKEFKGNDCSKMDYYTMKTVNELRHIAKVNGMRGYSRLRKADLAALVSSRLMQSVQTGHESNPLDASSPDINVPTLVPTKYTPPSKNWKSVFSDVLVETKNKVISKLNRFADWLINYVAPPEQKLVNERLASLKSKVSSIFSKINKNKFEIRETATAIKEFTKQYTIEGIDGIDALSFLSALESRVVSLLSQKINLVLNCTMERADTKTGEVDSDDIPFCSMTEVIL